MGLIRGVAHVSYKTADMDKAVAFYCGVLGMKDYKDIDRPDGSKWLKFIEIAPGQYLEMLYRDDGDQLEGMYSHLCLEVEDLDALVARLKEHKINLEKEPKVGVTGNYSCWAKDPDGNRIEFAQIPADSPFKG